MPSVFIAGAHTDIGKTHVACALIRAARRQGLAVQALKPVVSGFDENNWAESDPGRILTALGEAHTLAALDGLSPWRYAAPQSPPLAARLEGKTIVLSEVAALARARMAAAGEALLVIEGVGGLMSPLTDHETGLDLMTALGAPAVLVGGSYLGAISHILTAHSVLRSAEIAVAALVVSEGAGADAPFAPTVEAVRAFAGGALVIAAARDGGDGFAEELLAAL